MNVCGMARGVPARTGPGVDVIVGVDVGSTGIEVLPVGMLQARMEAIRISTGIRRLIFIASSISKHKHILHLSKGIYNDSPAKSPGRVII
jgi:hypothetical protein